MQTLTQKQKQAVQMYTHAAFEDESKVKKERPVIRVPCLTAGPRPHTIEEKALRLLREAYHHPGQPRVVTQFYIDMMFPDNAETPVWDIQAPRSEYLEGKGGLDGNVIAACAINQARNFVRAIRRHEINIGFVSYTRHPLHLVTPVEPIHQVQIAPPTPLLEPVSAFTDGNALHIDYEPYKVFDAADFSENYPIELLGGMDNAGDVKTPRPIPRPAGVAYPPVLGDDWKAPVPRSMIDKMLPDLTLAPHFMTPSYTATACDVPTPTESTEEEQDEIAEAPDNHNVAVIIKGKQRGAYCSKCQKWAKMSDLKDGRCQKCRRQPGAVRKKVARAARNVGLVAAAVGQERQAELGAQDAARALGIALVEEKREQGAEPPENQDRVDQRHPAIEVPDFCYNALYPGNVMCSVRFAILCAALLTCSNYLNWVVEVKFLSGFAVVALACCCLSASRVCALVVLSVEACIGIMQYDAAGSARRKVLVMEAESHNYWAGWANVAKSYSASVSPWQLAIFQPTAYVDVPQHNDWLPYELSVPLFVLMIAVTILARPRRIPFVHVGYGMVVTCVVTWLPDYSRHAPLVLSMCAVAYALSSFEPYVRVKWAIGGILPHTDRDARICNNKGARLARRDPELVAAVRTTTIHYGVPLPWTSHSTNLVLSKTFIAEARGLSEWGPKTLVDEVSTRLDQLKMLNVDCNLIDAGMLRRRCAWYICEHRRSEAEEVGEEVECMPTALFQNAPPLQAGGGLTHF